MGGLRGEGEGEGGGGGSSSDSSAPAAYLVPTASNNKSPNLEREEGGGEGLQSGGGGRRALGLLAFDMLKRNGPLEQYSREHT